MTKRFFKLIYILALIGLGLSLPIYLLTNIQFNRIFEISYRIKCLSNDKYVVLQGAQYSDQYNVIDNVYWESENQNALKRQYNFYCKYYDEIQPHVIAYIESKTLKEQGFATANYRNFEESVKSSVTSYPPLYELEVVSKEFQPYRIYGPIIDWFGMALGLFILLQAIRMCYVYVVFNEVVWHPFRSRRDS